MRDPGHDLRALAADLGVQSSYWDVRGHRRSASEDSLLAVIRAAGVPIRSAKEATAHRRRLARQRSIRGLDPVAVVWDGATVEVALHLDDPSSRAARAAQVTLVLDTGEERTWPIDLSTAPQLEPLAPVDADRDPAWPTCSRRALALPAGLPVGRHHLSVQTGDRCFESVVLSAPRCGSSIEPWERTWGIVAPVHSMWRTSAPGPDLSLLGELADWLAEHGGQVVATLPLLASFTDQPFDPSPYAPVSRQFWNELYLDLGRLPGTAARLAARAAADREPTSPARGARTFDHRAHAAVVRRVVGAAAAAYFESDDPTLVDAFVRSTPDALDFARFRAAADRFGSGWGAWPEPYRSGDLSGLPRSDAAVGYHLYAQAAINSQLAELSRSLDRRGQRLYLDLPVGSHPDGYDVWRNRHLFATGVSTGAPPDEFFESGQTWGFPPLQPVASRADGHRFFASCLQAHLRYARMLRIDHVMQLERLFWIPDGARPDDGVYVRYPREELLATVMIESTRSGSAVVGEDLGTVPDEIREAMHDHGLLGMYVFQFQAPDDGDDPPPPGPSRVCSVNTHDTPTFASFARGLDIDRRVADGQIGSAEAVGLHEERERRVRGLRSFLSRVGICDPDADERSLLRAVLHWMAQSESPCLLVTLDDLWSETEPQNVPGTPVERPNWVLRWPQSIEELARDASLAGDLAAIQAHRLAAFAAATESR